VSQLERSILFLKLELARTDPKEFRARVRQLQLEIKTKEAELESLRRASPETPPKSK
jgi:hypothetical protein